MATRTKWMSPLALLQLITGIYLVSLGVSDLIAYNSEWNQFARSVADAFGESGNALTVIISILEIAAGAVLIWVLFGRTSGRVVRLSCVVIAALWLIRVLVAYVFNDIFEPSFFTWLALVSGELIPGAVVWMIGSQYR
jgi:hypothetical protein